jgi:hypothetical protein
LGKRRTRGETLMAILGCSLILSTMSTASTPSTTFSRVYEMPSRIRQRHISCCAFPAKRSRYSCTQIQSSIHNSTGHLHTFHSSTSEELTRVRIMSTQPCILARCFRLFDFLRASESCDAPISQTVHVKVILRASESCDAPIFQAAHVKVIDRLG